MDVVINTYDVWFKINATNMNTMLQKAINTTWVTHEIIILIRLKLNLTIYVKSSSHNTDTKQRTMAKEIFYVDQLGKHKMHTVFSYKTIVT